MILPDVPFAHLGQPQQEDADRFVAGLLQIPFSFRPSWNEGLCEGTGSPNGHRLVECGLYEGVKQATSGWQGLSWKSRMVPRGAHFTAPA